ncbi:MAG: FtsX-like permease family protein [Cyclobacteriaceae bacterium]
MRLERQEIAYIRNDLNKKGFAKGSLLDELVDHVCCEMEDDLKRGVPFKKAYERVLQTITPDQIKQVQAESFSATYPTTRAMLFNTLKMMWRQATRFRVHTAINVTGLTIGFIVFTIVALFLKHELDFDKQFTHAEDIYRITMSSTVGGVENSIPTTFPVFGPELQARYGEVADYARVINHKYTRLRPTFRYEDKIFYEDGVIFADSTFFRLFDFPFLSGDAVTALNDPNSVVLTSAMAEKYFGTHSPVGQTIRFNDTDLLVTGVLKELPSNTHMKFDFVIPMSGLKFSGAFRNLSVLNSWDVDWFWNYLLISDGEAVEKIENGITSLAQEQNPEQTKEHNVRFALQHLTDIHLFSEFDYNTDISSNGNLTNLYILVSIGVLVLMISSINFINLSMSSAARRYKEIGVSKILGAMRTQLRIQYLLEAVLICVVSFVLAIGAVKLILPVFSTWVGVEMILANNYGVVILLFLFTIVLGLLSGAYPAFFMSSLEPQRVLKGVWKPGHGGAYFRKVLIGVQVTISIFLMVGTIVVSEQLSYINHRELGFDKEHVIMLPIRGTQISRHFVEFKQQLLGESSIGNVTSVSEPIGREVQFMSFKVEGKQEDQFVKILNVTHDFVQTMNLQLLEGRDMSPEIGSDSVGGFVINEAAAKAFGWDEAVGKHLQHVWREGVDGRVIGVVKDFNFEPLQNQVDPIVIWFGGPYWYAAIKTQPGAASQAISAIEAAWKKLEPEKPFDFQFLDAAIQKVYEREERMSEMFFVFAIISIGTAMLGLYGLISFILNQRLKEIGVRKVMGASSNAILLLISGEYVKLVFISFMAAVPLSYWVMNYWLQTFAFRISWSPAYFIIAFGIAIVVVLATVLSRAGIAADLNPAKVLRSE